MEFFFVCIRNFGFLLCFLVNFFVLESKSFVDVIKMVYFFFEIFKDSFFILKLYCNKSELFLGIGSVVFIFDWEYIMLRVL